MNYEKDDSIKARQKFVRDSGEELERFVCTFLNKRLAGSGIIVKHEDEVVKDKKIFEELSIPVDDGRTKSFVWGDADLVVVLNKNKPIAIISCKTSLHGRLTESLFYSLYFRHYKPHIKYFFVTTDVGRGQGKWASEWGTPEKPTKDRLMGSTFLDGVYVCNPKTVKGGKIKDLEELPSDLKNLVK